MKQIFWYIKIPILTTMLAPLAVSKIEIFIYQGHNWRTRSTDLSLVPSIIVECRNYRNGIKLNTIKNKMVLWPFIYFFSNKKKRIKYV